MILPKEIKSSRHKIRDAQIVKLYIDGLTENELSQRFEITQQRINQILYANRHLLLGDIKYEKAKRLHRLKRIAKKLPDELKSKDIIDVQAEMRKELEGDDRISITQNYIQIEKSPAIQNRLDEISEQKKIA